MSFIHPWFLLGLFSTLIPVIIHLFELKKPKRILFTNVEFIQEIKLVSAKQHKLKHILILLCRISFLTFLVFMFSQPFIPSIKQGMKSAGVVGVVVDSTPSMQAGRNEQSMFEQAIIQARELPVSYPVSTNFVISPAVGQPLSAASYRSEIDRIQISSKGTGLTSAFNQLKGTQKKVEQVFVFSDFQKNGFSVQSIEKLDSLQEVFLVPIGKQATGNVFVDSVWLDDAFVRRGADITLRIRLRNGGLKAVKNCQVKLLVDNRQATAFKATVSPNQSITMNVRLRLEQDQLAQCRVQIEDFPVSFDNSFYFTLKPSPRISVLDVAAGEVAPTQKLYANEPLFSYNSAKSGNISYQTLEAANLVVLQPQTSIDVGLRESVKRAIEGGGSVVIIPPAIDKARSSYDLLFKELGIGPVQWVAAGSAPLLREVAVPSRQNPFFNEVFGAADRQPMMPKASPVLNWSRSGTDIMKMRDGDGFLASFFSGKGTVYLFASPFNDAYSDFAQHALFVPVMYKLAMQSYQRAQLPAYRLNQGTIAISIASETTDSRSEQVFKLTKDSSTFIPNQRLQGNVLRLDIPVEMRDPGFYKLTRNGQVLATLAFNLDKRESELASYSAAELQQLVGPSRPNVHVYETSLEKSVAAKYKAERVGTPLWHYCLWAALVCLLAEVLLLRFAGAPRMTEAKAMAA